MNRGPLARALLYARTLRHLNGVQLLYQPLRRLQGRPAPRRASAVLGTRAEAIAAALAARPDPAAGAEGAARDVLEGRFTFLNHTETLGPADWTVPGASRLWTYHLHYFGFAPQLARAFRASGDPRFARRFESLVDSWVEAESAAGWEPYPISVRVPNWLEAVLLFGRALRPEARERVLASAARQLTVLERRLEVHVQANHLFKNRVALAVGGLVLDGPAAARWRRRGLAGVWSELEEQVLPDGGHYERSPMYHAALVWDALGILDLCAVAGEPVPRGSRARVAAMVRALGVLSRPTGRLHLFNDAALRQAPAPAAIGVLARRVLGEGVPEPSGVLALPDTGYFGLADPATGDRILVDCGPLGPDHQPAHAHCDLLSFELDLGGVPFAVDAGVHGYEGDYFREYVRSTRAHNTVMVGGKEQAEMWATFRVARRPRVLGAAQTGAGAAHYRFRGAYSPYHAPRCRHVREIQRDRGVWTVTDRVEAAAGAEIASFLHLHPDWTVQAAGASNFVARRGNVAVSIEAFGVDGARVFRGERQPVQGWYCPEFGRAVPAPAIQFTASRNEGRPFGYRIRPL